MGDLLRPWWHSGPMHGCVFLSHSQFLQVLLSFWPENLTQVPAPCPFCLYTLCCWNGDGNKAARGAAGRGRAVPGKPCALSVPEAAS